MSAPAQNVGSYSGIDARRSSRVERTVPLYIMGTDRFGQSFVEESSVVSLNRHGCQYSSRHELPLESRVTLRVTRSGERAHPLVVRARVCSILSPQTPGEFYQVGVEFETPGNLWGIYAPPDDWQCPLERAHATTLSAAAVAPAREPAMHDQAREIVPGKPEPAVARADELLTALQRKLQQAADKAVENAITTRLDDAVRIALERIEEASRTNAPQSAWIDEPQGREEDELDAFRSRAEEIAKRLESLMSSARSNLSEMRNFVEHVTRNLEPQLHARLNETFGQASRELENTTAQASKRQFEQFALDTKAVLEEACSHLDARVAAARPLFENALNVRSPEHIETLLHSLKEETIGCLETRLQEMSRHSEEQQDLQRNRLTRIEQKLDELSSRPLQVAGGAGKPAAQVVHDVEPRVRAMVEESVGRAAKDFENVAARASDRQLVRLMDERQRFAREASLELEAGVSEAKAVLLRSATVTLEQFRRQLGVHMELAMSETAQRMASSLGSLDAENRAACEARRRTLESEVARAAEQSTQELRTGMKAFLYSCLVAAVSAVDEHAQTTLKGLSKNAVNQPHDLMPFSEASGNSKNGSSGDDSSH
jgi:hypothetical protein